MAAEFARILTNSEARRLLLARQCLAGTKPAGLSALIDRLGYVQLDSIRVVERAHHHILFARDLAHRPAKLDRLFTRERALFEHWTHDASLIPIAFYPHWRHRFDREVKRIAESRGWLARMGGAHIAKDIRQRIERTGPLRARDIENQTGRTGPWWGWSREKAALEYLWFTGVLAIAERDGFQKVYDLAERVIPAGLRTADPAHRETVDWACGGALARLGAATVGELADFWSLATRQEAAKWAEQEIKAKRLITVGLTGHDGKVRAALARPSLGDEIRVLPFPSGRLRFLSPFDPVLRNRQRTQRLFGFDYRIEVFVPAAKRRYGYYVFPIFEGERFTGRIDLKADRANDVLRVQGLWLEPAFKLTSRRRARLEAELDRQARLAGVASVEFPSSSLRS